MTFKKNCTVYDISMLNNISITSKFDIFRLFKAHFPKLFKSSDVGKSLTLYCKFTLQESNISNIFATISTFITFHSTHTTTYSSMLFF